MRERLDGARERRHGGLSQLPRYYVPTTMLLAPFVVADSDGIWKPEQLDVRFWKLKGVLHYELSTRHLSFVVVLVSK